jgi:hypothetical protein
VRLTDGVARDSLASSAGPGQIAVPFIGRHADDDLHTPPFFRAQVVCDNLADQTLAIDGVHLRKLIGGDDPDDALVVVQPDFGRRGEPFRQCLLQLSHERGFSTVHSTAPYP